METIGRPQNATAARTLEVDFHHICGRWLNRHLQTALHKGLEFRGFGFLGFFEDFGGFRVFFRDFGG